MTKFVENATIIASIMMSGAVITPIQNVMGAPRSTTIPVETLRIEQIRGSQLFSNKTLLLKVEGV